jgi:hypothetical protein
MKMTAYLYLRKYSAEVAPRVPALKLSRNLTTLSSRGTVVPPLVTSTTFLPSLDCLETNSRTAWTSCSNVGGGGWVAKYSSAEKVEDIVLDDDGGYLILVESWL